jgi:hypothetical protein
MVNLHNRCAKYENFGMVAFHFEWQSFMGFMFWYIKIVLVERKKKNMEINICTTCWKNCVKHLRFVLNGVSKLFPNAKHSPIVMVLRIVVYQKTFSFFNHRFLVEAQRNHVISQWQVCIKWLETIVLVVRWFELWTLKLLSNLSNKWAYGWRW